MDDHTTPNVPSSLSAAQIDNLPPSFYYIPNFLTPTECRTLLQKIPPKRWTQLTHRRLQAHPSTLTSNNTLISAPLPPWLTASPPVTERFAHLGLFKDAKHGAANHVLVNEYAPGEGIMPHEDGPAYSPVVATVSLGGAVVLDLYAKKEDRGGEEDEAEKQEPLADAEDGLKPSWRILQEPGSLLVTVGEAYVTLLHGISPVAVDEDLGPLTVANWSLLGDAGKFDGGRNVRETRTSLTYRDVLKVSKLGIGILGRR